MVIYPHQEILYSEREEEEAEAEEEKVAVVVVISSLYLPIWGNVHSMFFRWKKISHRTVRLVLLQLCANTLCT